MVDFISKSDIIDLGTPKEREERHMNGEKTSILAYFKRIMLFCIPLMLTGVLQQLYNAADLVVVGRFESELALAAVGSTTALTNLILNIFMGLAVGAGVCVAHGVGAKDMENIRRTTHTAVLVAIIGGAIMAVVGYFLAPFMLGLMDTPADVMPLSTTYIKIIFIGAPGAIMYNYCASMIRATGDSKRPLIFISISGVLNVLLNLFFVVVLRIGVAGVAIATIIAQYSSALMCIVYMTKTSGPLKLSLKHLRIYPRQLGKILIIGIPSGIQGSFFSFSNVMIQSSINSFGSTVMAGSSASSNIEGFAFIIYHAFYDAALTYIGQMFGAKQYDRMKKVLFASFMGVLLTAVAVCAVSMPLRAFLLKIYIPDNPDALAEGLKKFVIMVPWYFLCGFMEIGSGTLRGMGRSMTSAVISLIGVCGLRVIWLETIFKQVNTPECIYFSYPISWVLTAAVSLTWSAIFIRKKVKEAQMELSQ